MRRPFIIPAVFTLVAAVTPMVRAQDAGVAPKAFDEKHAGNDKMHMVAHVVSHPGAWKAADIEIEQDRNRPYVYVCGFVNFDAQIYDISNTAAPKKIYDWTIENPELHRGIGAMDGKYFKIGTRYYYAQSYQFIAGQPRRRSGRRDLRRHRSSRSRARSRSSRAFATRRRPADSTTRSRTSTPMDVCCTSRRSTSRRRSSTISPRS